MEEEKVYTKFFISLMDLLDENGFTIMSFSKVLGIDETLLYNYKAGDMPSIKTAVAIANYFDCTLNFLMGLDDKRDMSHFKSYDTTVFYERYRILLKEKNISNYRISKDTGIDDSSDYSWQKGCIPTMTTLIKIAEYLNCQIDYLIGRM